MTPGTKNQRLRRSGLYQGRCSSCDRRNLLDELRRDAADALLLHLLREAERDLRDVSRGNERGVGVGGVDDHLQRRGLALEQLLRKAGVDFERKRCLALVDEVARLACVGQLRLHVEVGAGGETRDEFAALLAVVEIDDYGRNVVNFKGGGVAEDEHLHDRRTDQDEARALVAHHLDEFLDQHLLEPAEHRSSPLLRVSCGSCGWRPA